MKRCALNTGYWHRLCTNQGSAFTSNEWKQLTELNEVKLCLSGVTAHIVFGSGGLYYERLRRNCKI